MRPPSKFRVTLVTSSTVRPMADEFSCFVLTHGRVCSSLQVRRRRYLRDPFLASFALCSLIDASKHRSL